MMDDCRMTVLDVGQGQSIILQSEGQTFLVDCGGSYADDAADKAAETLLSMGIGHIDGLILTHYDTDHAGGTEQFLSRIKADMLFLPTSDGEDTLADRLSTRGGVFLIEKDTVLTYDSTQLTIFTSESKDSGNESSLCVLFQAGNCDILITGDRSASGERQLLEKADLPELEVLVAGHHGSKKSTCEELLAATSPKVVVISVGANNAYGHPAQELLERLEAQGCIIFRTDQDGTIIIRR
jgi:competence protein ComEC